MGGGWNYKRLRNLAHKHKNIEEMYEEKQKGKFPYCRGKFDTCPEENELETALKNKMAPAVCGNCPVFHESNIKGLKIEASKPRMSEEDIEFFKKVMGKNN